MRQVLGQVFVKGFVGVRFEEIYVFPKKVNDVCPFPPSFKKKLFKDPGVVLGGVHSLTMCS